MSRSRIYATDPDPARLACAQAGLLGTSSARLAEHNYRTIGGRASFDAYLEQSGSTVTIAHRFKRAIVWGQFSLETGYSFNEFALILCRDALCGVSGGVLRAALRVMTQSLSISGLLARGCSDHQAAHLLSDCYREWSGAVHVRKRVC